MDDEIIDRFKIGDAKGIDLLIDRYHYLIYGVIYSILHTKASKEDIEECYNDIIFTVWTKIDQYDEAKGNFKNWFISIMKYKAIDMLRQEGYKDIEETLNEESVGCSPSAEEELIKQEMVSTLTGLIEQLDDIDQQVFKWRYFEDVPIAEIAKRLGLSTGAVYTKISRGKKKLKEFKEMEAYDYNL